MIFKHELIIQVKEIKTLNHEAFLKPFKLRKTKNRI